MPVWVVDLILSNVGNWFAIGIMVSLIVKGDQFHKLVKKVAQPTSKSKHRK